MKETSYIAIYKKLKASIVNGSYVYGEKLPSKRDLSCKMGVSVITTAHAYELLEEEGYIESRQRSGYYVIYRKDDFPAHEDSSQNSVEMNEHETTTCMNYGREAVSFFQMSKTIRKVMLDYGERIMEKSPNQGCWELREQIRRYLMRSRDIVVSVDQIVVSSGAEQLYGMINGMFPQNMIFGIENPCYEKIHMVYSQSGRAIERLKLGSIGIMSESLKSSHAGLLHVTPFHSFPSGATADVSKKNEYLQWAKARQAYIVEDNYDSELTVSHKNEEALFEIDNGESVIYINTFSKTISPSIRVGYMILPTSLLKTYQNRYGNYSCTVPVLEQLFLADFLGSGAFEQHINRVRRTRRALKSRLH